MRNGQNKRMRGRNRGKGGYHHHHHQNPMSRMYESNGPDVKIRGNAAHVAEKCLQPARDAQSSGDPIAAENYFQHAEHYFRLIAAAQEHLRQTQPNFQQQPPPGEARANSSDDSDDDGDNEQPHVGGEPFAPREQQSFYPREQQQQPQQQPHQHHQQPQSYQQPHSHQQPHSQPQNFQPRPQHFQQTNDEDVERLPSFITGGGQAPQQQSPQQGQDPNGSNGQNGYDGAPDRFPLHRRRRRHRGPRDHSMSGDGDAPLPSGNRPTED